MGNVLWRSQFLVVLFRTGNISSKYTRLGIGLSVSSAVKSMRIRCLCLHTYSNYIRRDFTWVGTSISVRQQGGNSSIRMIWTSTSRTWWLTTCRFPMVLIIIDISDNDYNLIFYNECQSKNSISYYTIFSTIKWEKILLSYSLPFLPF